MTGFEPATSCTPCKYATELRYIPYSFRVANLMIFFKNAISDLKKRGVWGVKR